MFALKGQNSAPVTVLVLGKGGRGSSWIVFLLNTTNSQGRGWALQYASEELGLPRSSRCCWLGGCGMIMNGLMMAYSPALSGAAEE